MITEIKIIIAIFCLISIVLLFIINNGKYSLEINNYIKKFIFVLLLAILILTTMCEQYLISLILLLAIYILKIK